MTRLRVKLHQPWADGQLQAAAVASVRLLADTEGRIAKSWLSREEPVPVVGGDGSGGKTTSFELPGGGTYGVEITRPRGPTFVHEVRVAEGEDHDETIRFEVSPHEYLGWHQFAGVVRPDPYHRETVPEPSGAGPERFEALQRESREHIQALHSRVKDLPHLFKANLPAGRDAWDWIALAAREEARNWIDPTPLPELEPSWDDQYATWFLRSPGGAEGLDLITRLKKPHQFPDDLATRFPRWLAFDVGGKVDLASIPWAWWGANPQTGGEIRVIYDRVRSNVVDRSQPGRLTVSVLDSRWFGLLEFLASGRLSRTAKMVEEVAVMSGEPENALRAKVKGPLVATAGALVLIASAQRTREPWDQWLANLRKWFPGIPDGAVLLGCRRVAQARNLADLERAFGKLREGVDRGIPFFSATILMLSVTLSQIAADLPEAESLRRFVAPVLTRLDPEQPFTVLRL